MIDEICIVIKRHGMNLHIIASLSLGIVLQNNKAHLLQF